MTEPQTASVVERATDAALDPAAASLFDPSALIEPLAAVLSTARSSDLAMRCLRLHAWVAAAGTTFAATLDCTRPTPVLELGHNGSCHVLVYADESAVVALLAAYSFHDLVGELAAGTIRLQRGLFNALRLVRDPRERRENTALRAQLEAALSARRRSMNG